MSAMTHTADARTVRKAVFASTVGSAIEWFDFMLYGAAAALIFPALFFPNSSPVTGVLLAFSTYFVGFLARPLGAAIFGHLGDRVGRKKALMWTIVLMGIGTVGIGLVPTYATIGAFGPVLLVALRTLQGIGVGGEWGGAVLLAMESGRKGGEGFRGSFPQAAGTIGIGCANLAFMAMSLTLSPEAFMAWGWRVPFLFSFVLIILALWIRSSLPETTAFAKVQQAGDVSKAPVLEVLKNNPVQVLLAALLKSAEMIPVYIFIAFILSYGTGQHDYNRTTLLLMVSMAAFLAAVSMLIAGRISDRIGHERMYAIGAISMGIFAFVYFGMIESGSIMLASFAILISLLPYSLMFAPEPIIISKAFPTRTRYSGSSLGFNLAGIIGGGPAPFIATWLATSYGGYAVAVYIAIFCLVGVVASRVLMRMAHQKPSAPVVLPASVGVPSS
ncbi:MAG: MHS family MFS transporter [Nocardioidaceae bacterium]|nr:MHS family MFS transporter [Nocardioidaceae bacterium]